MSDDVTFMRRALDLARNGRYSTSPNPMVGCVIVRDGRTIGEGFHLRAGLPHAEAAALASCSESPEGATVYVTLEPCSHQGRTGPCADALIEARVARVVVACGDPSEKVSGKGIERLRAAGIRVDTGVLEQEAMRLNEKFLFASVHYRPFLLLKAGMTLDGKLATEARKSQWITSEEARQRSLLLREEYDAILVGSGTIRDDNPHLTRRLEKNSSILPWLRVVVDGEGLIPPASNVLADGGRTLVFTPTPERYPQRDGMEVMQLAARDGRIDLLEVLAELDRREIRSVIAEGGSMLHSELIREQLWQKMILFVAPKLVGGKHAPSIFAGPAVSELTEAHEFRFDAAEMVGPDLMITAYPRH